MARGGLSYGDIGFGSATFEAHSDIIALVASGGKDSVVGLPVVIVGNNKVGLGTDGDVPYGFIDACEQKISQDDIYATEVFVGVQFGGFREDVPTVDGGVVAGRLCVVNGSGKIKDSSTGIGVKQKMTKVVTAAITNAEAAGDVTVTVKATGGEGLTEGKAIAVTLEATDLTVELVAAAIRAELADDDKVKAFFAVSGDGANVVLEALEEAAHDANMAITFADTDTTGATMGDTTVVNGQPDRKIGLPTIVNCDTVKKIATVFLG